MVRLGSKVEEGMMLMSLLTTFLIWNVDYTVDQPAP